MRCYINTSLHHDLLIENKLKTSVSSKDFVALPTDRRTNIYRIDAHLFGESAQKKLERYLN